MRKTAEPRENKIGPRADCQNKSDVSRHSNARPDSAKMSIVGHGLARSLTSLTRFGTSFWALGVAKYNEQYRSKAGGKELERPNLKAFYALMRFIASPDRSIEAWAAVGGNGLKKPSLTEKNTLTLPNIPRR